MAAEVFRISTSPVPREDFDSGALMLTSVSGPREVSLALEPGEQVTLGRLRSNRVVLDHPEVSKNHAALSFAGDGLNGAWMISDLGSRHGTRLNGVALQPHRTCPVHVGDLIEISPWTFRVMPRSASSVEGTRISTVDDQLSAGSSVARIRSDGSHRELARERLDLLLRYAEALQTVTDEATMARVALDAAVSGTGYRNAAITGPMTPDGAVELIACCGEIDLRQPRLSRSLLRAASRGVPVQLHGPDVVPSEAFSIVDYRISDAMCVPLMMESTVAGFLYLDNRAGMMGQVQAAREACAFAVGVGRLVSMAWSNLTRRDLERRYARMEGELAAAARAQQIVLPPREGRFGRLHYFGECRAGRIVSGDFFDVMALGDDLVAVTIGDVAGKSVAASVMMMLTQGFLRGALRQHGDLVRALHDLNHFAHQRSEVQKFVTLWAGLFDLRAMQLMYADAGHGYAWLAGEDGRVRRLSDAGGPPIAVTMEASYQSACVPLEVGARFLLVSDGVVEQPGHGGDAAAGQYGWERVASQLASGLREADPVAQLFTSLCSHAGSEELADDATVVLVQIE